jgi:hypothetical protein
MALVGDPPASGASPLCAPQQDDCAAGGVGLVLSAEQPQRDGFASPAAFAFSLIADYISRHGYQTHTV